MDRVAGRLHDDDGVGGAQARLALEQAAQRAVGERQLLAAEEDEAEVDVRPVARRRPSASSIITASAPFMSAAPRPWTTPSSARPGRLSWAGTVSRWPARRTSGRSPRAVAPARTQVSPASRAATPPERGRRGRARRARLVAGLGGDVDQLEGAGGEAVGRGHRRRIYAARATTPADAHVASAYGRSASATPRRSGWSRSIGDRARVGRGRAPRSRWRRARPTGRPSRRAARGGSGPRGARRSRARGPPRTGRPGPASRCRSPAARRRRGSAARGGSRRRGCPRSSGRTRRSSPTAARRSMSASVTWMPWTTLVRSPRKPAAREQLDRRAAVLGVALARARGAARGRGRGGRGRARVGVGGDRLEPRRRHGADAVRGEADRDAVAVRGPRAQVVDAAQERLDVGVAEAPLARARRAVAAVPAVAVVGGGEQHDPQAGRDRRLGHARSPSRSGSRTACRRAVVDVVELADGAVAGRGHLGVDARPRRRASCRGRARPRAGTSRVAPAPEVVAGLAGRSATPRRSRWKACEWALTIAGTARRRSPRSRPRGATRCPAAPTRAAADDTRRDRVAGEAVGDMLGGLSSSDHVGALAGLERARRRPTARAPRRRSASRPAAPRATDQP